MADNSADNNVSEAGQEKENALALPVRAINYQKLLELPDLSQEFLAFSPPFLPREGAHISEAFKNSGADGNHQPDSLSLASSFSTAGLHNEGKRKPLDIAFSAASTIINAKTNINPSDQTWANAKSGIRDLLSSMILNDLEIRPQLNEQYDQLIAQNTRESAGAQTALITSATRTGYEAQAEEFLSLRAENENLEDGLSLYENRLEKSSAALKTSLIGGDISRIFKQEKRIEELKSGQENFRQGIGENALEITALKEMLSADPDIAKHIQILDEMETYHKESLLHENLALENFDTNLEHKNILHMIWAGTNFQQELKNASEQTNEGAPQIEEQDLRKTLKTQMDGLSIPEEHLKPLETLMETLLRENGIETTITDTPLFSASLDITSNKALFPDYNREKPPVTVPLTAPEQG